MLREIEHTSPHYSDITQTFAHILAATNEDTSAEHALRVQNPYAYSGPETLDDAERAQQVLLGAVALTNNTEPPIPIELVDRVRDMRLAIARTNGTVFAAAFVSPEERARMLANF